MPSKQYEFVVVVVCSSSSFTLSTYAKESVFVTFFIRK